MGRNQGDRMETDEQDTPRPGSSAEHEDDAGDTGDAGDAEVAGLIRRVRRRAEWSQRDLAEQLGVSQSAVAKWETGRTTPSARVLARILTLGELRLVAVDSTGAQVAAMRSDAARDAGGRRYPAHMFVWTEGWWAPPGADMTAWIGAIQGRSRELELPRVRFGSDRMAWRAQAPSEPDDHPTWRELVEQAKGGWSQPSRPLRFPIPAWALADSRKSRNRSPADFWTRGAPTRSEPVTNPLGRTG
ncbi:helix-turn-helix domain-containing protein [Nocardioides currus]|uniref:HTH cro/C1-type domain-containing protein n=1 Tax=Nocardioides currus TaxID=2133958 RepID=A0A2R7YWW9_9ACTN|nr:helix-turn-helix transcriptional regulator [Nocardioides currus]PUA80868.1 hypothetical protein C7S10_10680 [Nocardioides currus]